MFQRGHLCTLLIDSSHGLNVFWLGEIISNGDNGGITDPDLPVWVSEYQCPLMNLCRIQ